MAYEIYKVGCGEIKIVVCCVETTINVRQVAEREVQASSYLIIFCCRGEQEVFGILFLERTSSLLTHEWHEKRQWGQMQKSKYTRKVCDPLAFLPEIVRIHFELAVCI